MFHNFKTARFHFTLKAVSLITLPPYKGSTIRGGFGVTFKKVVCAIKRTECPECLLYKSCIYPYIFETPPPEDSEILKKYAKIPHPFIIEPPLETKRDYKEGEELNFKLILIGKAIDYLPYFIYTFNELGNAGIGQGRGRFELVSVKEENSGSIIYSEKDKTLHKFEAVVFKDRNIPAPLLTINFITPARLLFKEDLILDIEFHHIIRALLRRLSSLSYFHCGERLEVDFKGLIEKAKEIRCKDRKLYWYDWERYSNRQKTKMSLGGFKGSITFEGDISLFAPFLRLGEIVHIGKGTAFGLGKYEIKNKKNLTAEEHRENQTQRASEEYNGI